MRMSAEQTRDVPERAENESPALDRLLTRGTVRPALWVALRRGDSVQTGYIIACEPVLMLHLDEGVTSLTWGDPWQLYDETP